MKLSTRYVRAGIGCNGSDRVLLSGRRGRVGGIPELVRKSKKGLHVLLDEQSRYIPENTG